MFSKFFAYEEQLRNYNEDTGIQSRVISSSPELMLMEWRFPKKGSVTPMHDHYHVQMTYFVKGSVEITFADGSKKIAHAGDAVSFAPGEEHGVVTLEPDTIAIDAFAPLRLDHLEKHRKFSADEIQPYSI